MKRFVAVLGLLLAVNLPLANAQQSSDDRYIAIYNQILQADNMDESGQTRSALAQYTQAQAELAQFQKEYPDWDPNIVKYRLQYLVGKINQLTAQFPTTSAPAAAVQANPATPASTNTAAIIQQQQPSIADMQAQLQNLQTANETLQAKLKEALAVQPATTGSVELTQAQDQIRSLMKENELLRATVNNGAGNAIAPAELQALQSTNEMLREKLSQALGAPVATIDTQELAQAQEQIRSLMRENDQLRTTINNEPSNVISSAELQAMQSTNELLQEKLNEAISATAPTADTNELAQAQDQIRTLMKENDLLRATMNTSSTNAIVPTDIIQELNTLRARVAVDESQTIPYTADELALLKSSSPKPQAVVGSEAQPTSQLPQGSQLLIAEAQNYFSAREFDKADADYRKILETDPSNALVLANLATIEMEENKLADAENHIKGALAQTPNDAYDLSILGNLDYHLGKYDDALSALSRATKLDPQNPVIDNYLGVTLSHKGLREQAESALRKAIALKPDYGDAQNNLAVIYMSENPPLVQLARWHYQKALDAGEPRNADLEKMLAEKGAPVEQ